MDTDDKKEETKMDTEKKKTEAEIKNEQMKDLDRELKLIQRQEKTFITDLIDEYLEKYDTDQNEKDIWDKTKRLIMNQKNDEISFEELVNVTEALRHWYEALRKKLDEGFDDAGYTVLIESVVEQLIVVFFQKRYWHVKPNRPYLFSNALNFYANLLEREISQEKIASKPLMADVEKKEEEDRQRRWNLFRYIDALKKEKIRLVSTYFYEFEMDKDLKGKRAEPLVTYEWDENGMRRVITGVVPEEKPPPTLPPMLFIKPPTKKKKKKKGKVKEKTEEEKRKEAEAAAAAKEAKEKAEWEKFVEKEQDRDYATQFQLKDPNKKEEYQKRYVVWAGHLEKYYELRDEYFEWRRKDLKGAKSWKTLQSEKKVSLKNHEAKVLRLSVIYDLIDILHDKAPASDINDVKDRYEKSKLRANAVTTAEEVLFLRIVTLLGSKLGKIHQFVTELQSTKYQARALVYIKKLIDKFLAIFPTCEKTEYMETNGQVWERIKEMIVRTDLDQNIGNNVKVINECIESINANQINRWEYELVIKAKQTLMFLTLNILLNDKYKIKDRKKYFETLGRLYVLAFPDTDKDFWYRSENLEEYHDYVIIAAESWVSEWEKKLAAGKLPDEADEKLKNFIIQKFLKLRVPDVVRVKVLSYWESYAKPKNKETDDVPDIERWKLKEEDVKDESKDKEDEDDVPDIPKNLFIQLLEDFNKHCVSNLDDEEFWESVAKSLSSGFVSSELLQEIEKRTKAATDDEVVSKLMKKINHFMVEIKSNTTLREQIRSAAVQEKRNFWYDIEILLFTTKQPNYNTKNTLKWMDGWKMDENDKFAELKKKVKELVYSKLKKLDQEITARDLLGKLVTLAYNKEKKKHDIFLKEQTDLQQKLSELPISILTDQLELAKEQAETSSWVSIEPFIRKWNIQCAIKKKEASEYDKRIKDDPEAEEEMRPDHVTESNRLELWETLLAIYLTISKQQHLVLKNNKKVTKKLLQAINNRTESEKAHEIIVKFVQHLKLYKVFPKCVELLDERWRLLVNKSKSDKKQYQKLTQECIKKLRKDCRTFLQLQVVLMEQDIDNDNDSLETVLKNNFLYNIGLELISKPGTSQIWETLADIMFESKIDEDYVKSSLRRIKTILDLPQISQKRLFASEASYTESMIEKTAEKLIERLINIAKTNNFNINSELENFETRSETEYDNLSTSEDNASLASIKSQDTAEYLEPDWVQPYVDITEEKEEKKDESKDDKKEEAADDKPKESEKKDVSKDKKPEADTAKKTLVPASIPTGAATPAPIPGGTGTIIPAPLPGAGTGTTIPAPLPGAPATIPGGTGSTIPAPLPGAIPTGTPATAAPLPPGGQAPPTGPSLDEIKEEYESKDEISKLIIKKLEDKINDLETQKTKDDVEQKLQEMSRQQKMKEQIKKKLAEHVEYINKLTKSQQEELQVHQGNLQKVEQEKIQLLKHLRETLEKLMKASKLTVEELLENKELANMLNEETLESLRQHQVIEKQENVIQDFEEALDNVENIIADSLEQEDIITEQAQQIEDYEELYTQLEDILSTDDDSQSDQSQPTPPVQPTFPYLKLVIVMICIFSLFWETLSVAVYNKMLQIPIIIKYHIPKQQISSILIFTILVGFLIFLNPLAIVVPVIMIVIHAAVRKKLSPNYMSAIDIVGTLVTLIITIFS